MQITHSTEIIPHHPYHHPNPDEDSLWWRTDERGEREIQRMRTHCGGGRTKEERKTQRMRTRYGGGQTKDEREIQTMRTHCGGQKKEALKRMEAQKRRRTGAEQAENRRRTGVKDEE